MIVMADVKAAPVQIPIEGVIAKVDQVASADRVLVAPESFASKVGALPSVNKDSHAVFRSCCPGESGTSGLHKGNGKKGDRKWSNPYFSGEYEDPGWIHTGVVT